MEERRMHSEPALCSLAATQQAPTVGTHQRRMHSERAFHDLDTRWTENTRTCRRKCVQAAAKALGRRGREHRAWLATKGPYNGARSPSMAGLKSSIGWDLPAPSSQPHWFRILALPRVSGRPSPRPTSGGRLALMAAARAWPSGSVSKLDGSTSICWLDGAQNDSTLKPAAQPSQTRKLDGGRLPLCGMRRQLKSQRHSAHRQTTAPQRTFMAITVARECTLLSVRLLRLQDTWRRQARAVTNYEAQPAVVPRQCTPHPSPAKSTHPCSSIQSSQARHQPAAYGA